MHAKRITLGKSVEGRSLIGLEISKRSFAEYPSKCVLILGAFHGDEPKSVYLVGKLMEELTVKCEIRSRRAGTRFEKPSSQSPIANRQSAIRWLLVPVVNPDGLALRKRRNARKVDINRNFPTKNWEVGNPRSRMFGGYKPGSEPETRAVMNVIERYKPDAIITVHSINRNRFCNNFDGPGRALAKWLSHGNGYPVTSNIGYATPGSFGAWAGAERGIPTITLELPSHRSAKRCWEDNREALLSLGEFSSRKSADTKRRH